MRITTAQTHPVERKRLELVIIFDDLDELIHFNREEYLRQVGCGPVDLEPFNAGRLP